MRVATQVATASIAGAERHPLFIVAAFSFAFFWTTYTRSTIKPLWHDEIYSIIIAGLPSLTTIWRAQLAGLDAMPPFNSMLIHGVFAVVGGGQLSARLSSMFGVWALAIVCFVLVRRRSNTLAGLTAMLLVCCSRAMDVAYEARGYGMMLGLFALAVYCWSEAASNRRRGLHLPLMAFALAAGMWTHFYSALGVIPILAGEGARSLRSRRPDWGMWVSLVIAGVACLPLYPIIKLAWSQSATYFSHASLRDIPTAYMELEGPLLSGWGLAFAVLTALAVLLSPSSKEAARPPLPGLPTHELIAVLTILLIPLWAILIGALLASNAFVSRYAVSAVAGFCLVVPVLIARTRSDSAAFVLCLLLAGASLYMFRDVRPYAPVFQDPLSYRPIFKRALSEPTPVVVTGTLYLQLWYYVPPERHRGLTYVADPPAALRLLGTDSLDRDYLMLRDWASVQVEDYDAFIREHRHFRLYSVDALTWLPTRLQEQGAELREVGRESGATMYDVTLR